MKRLLNLTLTVTTYCLSSCTTAYVGMRPDDRLHKFTTTIPENQARHTTVRVLKKHVHDVSERENGTITGATDPYPGEFHGFWIFGRKWEERCELKVSLTPSVQRAATFVEVSPTVFERARPGFGWTTTENKERALPKIREIINDLESSLQSN